MRHKSPYYDPSSPSNIPIDWTTTHPQPTSTLASLPIEIRLKIWFYVWKSTGPVQHLIRSGLYHWSKGHCDVRFYHVACVTDFDNPDTSREGHTQNLHYEEATKRRAEDPTFLDGTDERWKWDCYYCKDHYDCFFDQSNLPFPPIEKSAFMGMILLCKSLHHEIVDSLYANVTFCMGLQSGGSFLQELRLPINAHMRSTILLLELEGPTESDQYAWDQILEAMKDMKQLRQVELWLDFGRLWRNNLERVTLENSRLIKFVAKLPKDVGVKVTLPKKSWNNGRRDDDARDRGSFLWWVGRGGGLEGSEDEVMEQITPLSMIKQEAQEA